MSFINFLKKMDKAIDQGLKVADEKTAFIDKAEVWCCRGKTADERCDQGMDLATAWARDKAIPQIKDKASFLKEKASDLGNKAKEQAVSAKNKVMNRVSATADTVMAKTEEVAKILEEIDIPVVVDDSQVIPMAKIIDCSHKVPQMDLRSDKVAVTPVKAKMEVFVNNAKDNTPFAEMR